MNRPYNAYVEAETLLTDWATNDGRAKAAQLLERARVSRVILESYRGGVCVDTHRLREIRDYFREAGFETMGGLMPIQGGNTGMRSAGVETRMPFFCYSALETVEALEAEITKLAQLFDRVVIDDAFATSCRCEACRIARGNRPWGVFRRDLLTEVATRWAAAAHGANPACRLVVKFPQYYDRYPEFGYDAERFPQVFDEVWVGTETRNPKDLSYGYTEQYQGYFNATWMAACAGEKFTGAWFDSLDCNDQLFYEQGVTTHLAAPGEITLFSYGADLFGGSKVARLAGAGPELDALTQAAEAPRGVHVVKPPNADGGRDLFCFDYLGMMGIPCVAGTKLDPAAHSVIVTTHAFADPDTGPAVTEILSRGGQVIATHGALTCMVDTPDVMALFGYGPEGVGANRAQVAGFRGRKREYAAKRPFHVAGDLAPDDADVVYWALLDSEFEHTQRVPFVTVKTYENGARACVWNVATFGHEAFLIEEPLNVPRPPDLFNLPTQLIKNLRHEATRPFGIQIDAPSRIATFWFARHVVFVNYTLSAVDLTVDGLKWEPKSLKTDSPNTVCSGATLLLAPRSYAMLETVAR